MVQMCVGRGKVEVEGGVSNIYDVAKLNPKQACFSQQSSLWSLCITKVQPKEKRDICTFCDLELN